MLDCDNHCFYFQLNFNSVRSFEIIDIPVWIYNLPIKKKIQICFCIQTCFIYLCYVDIEICYIAICIVRMIVPCDTDKISLIMNTRPIDFEMIISLYVTTTL